MTVSRRATVLREDTEPERCRSTNAVDASVMMVAVSGILGTPVTAGIRE